MIKLSQKRSMPRNTKAYQMATEYVKHRMEPDPNENKPLFKMKVFQTISPKIDSHNPIPLSHSNCIPGTTKSKINVAKPYDPSVDFAKEIMQLANSYSAEFNTEGSNRLNGTRDVV